MCNLCRESVSARLYITIRAKIIAERVEDSGFFRRLDDAKSGPKQYFFARWLKSNVDVEALCMFIFWMDGELKRLTLRIMVLDELKKEAKRFFSIASPLIV
ncbi:hypothetical protein KDI_36080 [Dictyobacter arantiisoli]|uniref:Uncharacterized protein n=1 Tax=Dictyobacter arantiisoli TaxID=2014874 RepID=A0A5A5TGH8_9CHLR|nr:hypothetical protein [Dictyobacter arantiisoli]GCF10044.1 hypothetical protein KDI_36080 [Dictyobacter arantiisoli]